MPALASRRLRAGGWAAASAEVAEAHGKQIGERMTLATPSGPQVFRLAALLTNVGWGPGTVILSARDYRAPGARARRRRSRSTFVPGRARRQARPWPRPRSAGGR